MVILEVDMNFLRNSNFNGATKHYNANLVVLPFCIIIPKYDRTKYDGTIKCYKVRLVV